MSNIRGIINLIKPVGISSFQAVKDVKKVAGIRKAGHTGTLDVLATGVLPICLNKATKVIPYLDESKKEYIAEIILGKTTRTLDQEGDIIEHNRGWRKLSNREIKETLESFIGPIKQIPPMFSAIHHNGKRLYRLAREGKNIKRDPRDINIYSLDIIKLELPVIKLKIKCSRGTYIRALARDIGKKLKVGAFLSFLIRTGSGPFNIEEAVPFAEIEKGNNNISNFISGIDFHLDYPSITVKEKALKKAVNGNCLQANEVNDKLEDIEIGDLIKIYGPARQFISISRVDIIEEELVVKPERVFI